jgi:hypothetical protein
MSSHPVTATGHAAAKRLVKVAASPVECHLLLLHVSALLLLLLLPPSPAPHAAKDSACSGADCRTFPGISPDGAPESSYSSSVGSPPKHAALRNASNWRGAARNSRICRVKAALLNRPTVALRLITLLLLRTLAPAWVDIGLGASGAGISCAASSDIASLIEASASDVALPTVSGTAETASKGSAAPGERFRSDRQSDAEHKNSKHGDAAFGPTGRWTVHQSSLPGSAFHALFCSEESSYASAEFPVGPSAYQPKRVYRGAALMRRWCGFERTRPLRYRLLFEEVLAPPAIRHF